MENNNSSLQTIDITVDENMKWKNIKQIPNLQFKITEDPEVIEQVIADKKIHHLNQAQGTSLTIQPVLSFIGTEIKRNNKYRIIEHFTYNIKVSQQIKTKQRNSKYKNK